MRIVHLNWSLGTGGTETMMVDIANEQARLGHDVSIVCLNDLIFKPICEKVSSGVKFYCLNRKPKSKGLIAVIKMNLLLYKLKPDILHVHPNSLIRLVKFGSYKTIRTIHSTQGDGKDSHLFSQLCFISEGVRQHSIKQGYDGTVVYNGIVCDSIKQKQKYNTTPKILRIVQIGRLEDFKGQYILLKAIAKLKAKGFNRYHVDFIGEGPFESNLKKLVRQLDLSDEVNFLGLRDRNYVYEHICDYDLFVQPSTSEGFGLTIAEAMAACVPVITSNLDGPMEVIDHGRFGLYFESGNPDALASILYDFNPLDLPYDIEGAREYVYDNFSIQRTAARYIDIYKETIDE